MGLVKYNGEGFGKTFNVYSELKRLWDKDVKVVQQLKGTVLQDRKNKNLVVVIKDAKFHDGTAIVYFQEGGWLCLDHALEQFKVINNETTTH